MARTSVSKIKRFWQDVMEDESVNVQYRLKASELVLKTEEDTKREEKEVVIISGEDKLED
ncbi:MAG: hypothetical protein IKM06_06650 [Clostridia bacterium]|jgi:hypothetical protein|nr:hypothetical protein [Clostridia bacterium]